VACAFNRQQLGLRRYQLQRLLDLWDRAEGIAGTFNKEGRRVKMEKVLRAKLIGLSRRMQRIRQQEEAGSQSRSFVRGFLRNLGTEHAGLPSAVGVAAEKYAAGREILDYRDCILQAGTIAFAVAWCRRSVGSILTVGEIAAQHHETSCSNASANAISSGAWQFDPAP